MSGLSEQGLPLDRWDWDTPLTLFTLAFYTKIGGSRDPPVPRETPAQNNEGQLVLSRVPPGQLPHGDPPIFIRMSKGNKVQGVSTLAIPQGDLCSEQPDVAYQSRA